MKLGMFPRYGPGANVTSPRWLAEWAPIVEAAGVESIWVAEHLVLPVEFDSPYPYSASGKIAFSPEHPFPDALHTLTYLAAFTTSVRLGTAIAVLPAHNPVEYATRCASVDVLSEGRLLLGIGLGWMKEEFDAYGVDFAHRGTRCDEYLEAMRTLWRDSPASYRGHFVRFEPVVINPRPVRPEGPPVIIGGSSSAAARRAGRCGDGYYPAAITPNDLALRLDEMRRSAEAQGRDPDRIEITVRPAGLSPSGSFDLELVREYARLGVDRVLIGADEAKGASPEASAGLVQRFRDEILSRL